ncbi:MAG TPA: tRNA (guanosine(37)-N1)-methyltransferase TrmD [Hyphomicrobium sp.]|jgi:tRNA (guanine37-N1)-methyltransferase|uniref:tRNA (guanosine(37)-N1)-methyltransferase TrmD n=1 Tax=Hyphomicrobium sp. TaxID=82 RepID=UPI002CA4226A|nr:tRNA (guanosine(37)-N1)-methyltransferase TrmD [Hyphomicrobium sp.]HXE00666.1 tRNA (guanosine(37)-N1)-methyltransferase TrmD [Hyphomicrobium sp.]
MPHIPQRDATRPCWRALVLTLFPEMFPGPLGISLAGQARDAGIWSLDTIQIRDFGLGKHRQVDDTPAGGGAGMVLRADVLGPALDHARTQSPDAPLIYLSPRGTPLTQSLARDLAEGPGVTLLAGRFEGVDERVISAKGLKEISIGDYVLAGGELAAMVLIEACVRLLPGVVGAAESLANESFETGLLEHPQYTKPRTWIGRSIPDVLLSGDHKKVEAWRRKEAERLTADRRPDLLRPHGRPEK